MRLWKRLDAGQRARPALMPALLGRWKLIAPRLAAGFLLPILLTGAIGIIAVQRFNALTTTTTELTTRDLPEVIAVSRLRTLLVRELQLEKSVTSDPAAQSNLRTLITAQRSALLALEPPDPATSYANDSALIRSLTGGVLRSMALAGRIQALRANGRAAQARALEQHQGTPLLQTVLAAADKLRTLEEGEATAAALHARDESSTATQLILALTLLLVPISILVALLLTRSLTKPLAALLRATKALAAGDLEASPGISSDDEIGQLALAFETMRSNLRTTIDSLELERHQTQAIIDASSDGVILVDGQHRIVQLNPAVETLSGWLADEAIGQYWWKVCGCSEEEASDLPWTEWTRQSDGSASRALIGDSLAGHTAEHQPRDARAQRTQTRVPAIASELLVQPRTGRERWLAFSFAPVPWDGGGSEKRLVVNLHDISDLKAIDQLKSDFVAMVSHELRAPLTTVAGAVEMLGAIDPTAQSDPYREVIGILQQQTRRLRIVVEEVLQVTRLEAGRLPVRLEPLPIVGLLHSVLDSIRQEWTADERALTVHAADGEALVWADPGMLEIVIRNLLENARKYTPSGSSIEIEVHIRGLTDRVQVRITDHGPGIPADQLDRIFERFSRGVQSSNEWTRGYGLGLYIARELVRAHGGEVWAENGGEGARFVVSLCAVASYETDRTAEQGDAL